MRYWLTLFILMLAGQIPMLVAAAPDSLGEAGERILPVFKELREENARLRGELADTYGEGAFYRCFRCGNGEGANPFALSARLSEAGYCLRGEETDAQPCGDGYVFSAGRCVTVTDGCREKFGEYGVYRGQKDGKGGYICACADGFGWNNDRTQCVQAGCPDDYIYYSPYREADGSFLHGRCMTRDDACRSAYGENGVFSRIGEYGAYLCACAAGYDWDSGGTACSEEVAVKGFAGAPDEIIRAETLAREKGLSGEADPALAARLSGRILLQVEESGEAWYVYPDDRKRYFLGSPAGAFSLMRGLGLGATHKFVTSYTYFPDFVRGKILIDVEDDGRAYYIHPPDGMAHYLGRPEDAFAVMRNLGLGIANRDLRKVEMGE